MVHDLMQRVAAADRRMKLVGELEVTLTAADKEALKAAQVAKAAELGIDASMVGGSVPDKYVPFAFWDPAIHASVFELTPPSNLLLRMKLTL